MKKKIAGIAVLCQTPDGEIVGDAYLSRQSDLRHRKYVDNMKGEHWGAILTEVARKYPFPEVKGFVPEGLVWMDMARDFDDLTVNEALRVYYQGELDALSKVRRSYGWVLYHRAAVRRDVRYAFTARYWYSVLVSILWCWK